MSRQVFLLGVGITLVAMAFALTNSILGPSPGVTEPNVMRIRKGMRLEEVEAILGKNYALRGGGGTMHHWMNRYDWLGADGTARVWFMSAIGDPQAVSSAEFRRTGPRGPLQRLRNWLGW